MDRSRGSYSFHFKRQNRSIVPGAEVVIHVYELFGKYVVGGAAVLIVCPALGDVILVHKRIGGIECRSGQWSDHAADGAFLHHSSDEQME